MKKMLTVTLQEQAWQIILNVLNEAPHKMVRSIIDEIQIQGNKQLTDEKKKDEKNNDKSKKTPAESKSGGNNAAQ